MEIGVYTFGDLPTGARDAAAARQRLHEIVAAARLADEAGLDVFGVGEHHRSDYVVSAHTVVLGALVTATRRIRLSSAVSILGSADPVRLFEDFATLDLLSNGRAELMAGRGAFVESFPLFGHALEDYESLFSEKLDLLLRLNVEPRIRWRGQHRPALDDVEVAPRPLQDGGLPIWIAAGGTPQSAVRAGRLGLPLNLANIGGSPAQFKPFIDLYRQSGQDAGHGPGRLKVAVSSHGHVHRDGQQAREAFYPYYRHYLRHNLPQRDRGWEVTPDAYAQLAGPRGCLFVGSPQEVAEKILYGHTLFGHQRFLMQLDIGGQPYDMVARAIELLATEVKPRVQQALGAAVAAPVSNPTYPQPESGVER